MNEEHPGILKAYKRAAIGLAVAAVFWTAAYFLVERGEGKQSGFPAWLIPIGAAVLSAWFFMLYHKARR
ncbi:MAG: hypothetical protein HOP19_28495 [Acidobacteria bacterium]|nr:hypothetical protein [Acidobacteriota bacterium]